jgi:hypothetical protein
LSRWRNCKLDSISMGDAMLTAAGRRHCYLPTLLCRKEDGDLRVVAHCYCWRGGKDDSVLSIGWQWTGWRTVGAGLKCGERERKPREAGASE